MTTLGLLRNVFEGSEVLRLEDPAETGVRAGTGVVVAMIPALFDHVAACTLVLIAVAKDDLAAEDLCLRNRRGCTRDARDGCLRQHIGG